MSILTNTQKGFQKTEFGEIPIDWLLVSYDEAFDFLTTATYSRAQLSENEEISYVHYGDIHTKCLHFLDFDKIILPTIKNELRKSYPLLKDGDVIIVDASEDYEGVGKSVEVKNLRSRKAISGLHTFLLRDNNESIARGFKGYIHSNKLVKKQMDTLATGLKVYGVSKTNLKKILIPLPPTEEEQSAIATALNDADELINSFEKLIAKKRMIKQGAMQELLKPKDGWEKKKLGEIGDFKNGINKSSEDFGFGYPFVNLLDVFGKTKINSNSHLDLINANESDRKNYELREGDVLFIRSSVKPEGVGLTVLIEKNLVNTVFSGFIIRFRDKGFLSNEFKEHCFLSSDFRNRLIANSTVSANTNINQDALKNLDLFFPKSKTEQTHISQILSDMDIEIEGLEKKLAKYKMLKQGMMQNLLTGKIRLV
ncbi:MAG: restriction endonuclease subunit S [Ignavibacteria bacterium]|nr:restriction endonuclease subunit S [Ignavibacteria bacterium]